MLALSGQAATMAQANGGIPKIKALKECPKCDTGSFDRELEWCVGCEELEAVEHLHVSCKKCGYDRLAMCHDWEPPKNEVGGVEPAAG